MIDWLAVTGGFVLGLWAMIPLRRLAYERACIGLKRNFAKKIFPENDSDEVKFLLIGDQGSGNKFQENVAASSLKTAADLGCDFTLLLGDNFIQHGVQAIDDPQFKEKFEDMYQHDMPFYAVLGNHDLRNSWPSIIDYTGVSKRWNLPAADYEFEAGPVKFHAFNSTCSVCSAWPIFKKSAKPWKIAFGHHPVLSSGRHGHMTWLERWIYLRSGADFLISGHNHLLEHLQLKGVDLITSGGGGGPLHPAELKQLPQSIYLNETYGYAWAHFTPKKAVIKFFDDQGAELYQYVKER